MARSLASSEGSKVHCADLRSLKTTRFGTVCGAILALGLAVRPAAAATPPTATLTAQPTGITQGVTTGAWSVQYDGFSHGLLVLKMRASLHFTPTGYEGALSFHTAGMVGWMVRSIDDSQVSGGFVHGQDPAPAADAVAPSSFVSIGSLRGVERVTRMTYRDGSPVIGTLTPDVLLERSAVPPSAAAHTIDTLSAIAMLVRQVGDSGRCDGSTMIFDGRRLTALAARTTGAEALAHTDRSIFAGQTLRCDFDGNQLAGFKKDESEAAQRRTRHGMAWLASVLPGAPPVPVRVIFDNKILGQVTLYLTAARAGYDGSAAVHG
jgi:hypothetical protein